MGPPQIPSHNTFWSPQGLKDFLARCSSGGEFRMGKDGGGREFICIIELDEQKLKIQ